MKTLYKACSDYIKTYSKNYNKKRILDLGCGEGYFTSLFGLRNNVIGIDLQNIVPKKYKNFIYRKADVTNLPFKSSSMDLVISFDVIEHIQNDKKMLDEAYRVLKKGGHILFGTPNRNRLANTILKIFGKPRSYPWLIGDDKVLGKMIHVREYDYKELSNILKLVGFKKINITPFWFGSPFFKYGFVKVFEFSKRYCQYYFFEASK
ncbi:MAG: methyltransferase domain-containing protein [Candidatus Roizmanbacteria bacterium]|nr:methyltransferase domain-containing protein [Candidatus Roizmanbacteria bacterium]